MKIEQISFVIPAWNEEQVLPESLAAIHEARVDTSIPYEIVVANDDSSDRTTEVAEACGARVVHCQNRQIAATRNSGAKAALGDLLIFVDADTVVTREAVAATVRFIENGATYGGASMGFDGETPRWAVPLIKSVLWFFRVSKLATGAYLFCTREAYDEAGGFDETVFAGEEYLFSKALRKNGRHAWVHSPITTSGRKLRTYSGWEIFRDSTRLLLGGKRVLRSRKFLDIWYETRRVDPHLSE